jgi:hypothetical protein
LVEEVSLSMKPPISDRLDQAIMSSAMHGDLVVLAREFVETQANPPKTKEELQVRLDQLKTLIAPIKKREAGNLIVQEPDVIVSNMPSTDAVDVAASGAKPSLENKFVVEAVNGRQDRSIDTISDEKAIVEAEVLTAIVTAVAVGVAFVAKFPMVIAGSPLLSSKFAAFMTWFQVRLNEFP